MRMTIIAAALLGIALPLAAQRQMGDPTKQVKGTGVLPSGWMVRFDPPRAGRAPSTPDMVNFVTMGSGYHFTTGPAGIYYNSKDVGSGVFGVTATFSQRRSNVHEAYGIFVGGDHLQDSAQSYLYFLVRPMDGGILIQHRNGDAVSKMDKLVTWTPDSAVNKEDPADGHATNTLTIHVAPDTVHFMVNGKLVKAIAKSALMGAATEGQTGIRINHNTDVHVDWKGVAK